MPMKKELTAKAESLAHSGRMPMISAAMSMSRIAIQERPMRLRTRFLASSARTATNTSRKRYFTAGPAPARSEEHTSELQSLMSISYAVFCLKKKMKKNVQQYQQF